MLAARAPAATVWAVDVNERALDLCARNAARAGLANVRCATPGDPALPASYAGIWSNPPIRIGKQALHALLGGWLPRLSPGAAATAVVQRHLGADSLQRWLTEQGWDVGRIASRAGYRVLRVTRLRPGPRPSDCRLGPPGGREAGRAVGATLAPRRPDREPGPVPGSREPAQAAAPHRGQAAQPGVAARHPGADRAAA